MIRIIFITALILYCLAACKTRSGKTTGEEGEIRPIRFTLTEAWRTDTLLRTPESVIYDDKRDVVYVTNVNLEPRKKDGNGFISRISTDGRIVDLKWIEGLHAPKGTAVTGDSLYVADIDELVVVDINKGTIARKVTIEGIGMINDITSDSEGNLYISDTDAGKIYKYMNGKLTVWLSEGLNLPNGLLAEENRILLASMGSSDLVAIDLETKSRTPLADSLNRADGIAFFGINDYYILTDWAGEIFMINPGRTRTSLLNTRDIGMNTADCTFLNEKGLLLVPTFFKNSVIAYRLTEINE